MVGFSAVHFEPWMSAVPVAGWGSVGEGQVFTVLYTRWARLQLYGLLPAALFSGRVLLDIHPEKFLHDRLGDVRFIGSKVVFLGGWGVFRGVLSRLLIPVDPNIQISGSWGGGSGRICCTPEMS